MKEDGNKILRTYFDRIVKPGYKVLEIGCGRCELLRELIGEYSITGVGIDPNAIEEKEERLACISMSGEEISLLREQFDIIFSLHTFHHLSDQNKFLRGAKKTLSPHGELLIVDWKKGTDTGVAEQYFSLSEVRSAISQIGLSELFSGETEHHFYICAAGYGQ